MKRDILRLALQKQGRIADDSMKLLSQAGFFWKHNDRRLSLEIENFPLEIIFLRNSDIPEILADEVADIGIIGENTLLESKFHAKIKKEKKLNFGACRLSIAVPQNSHLQTIQDLANKSIATSHPVILSKFLKQEGIKVKIIELKGSVEIAPALKIADSICDLVSSGNTLKSHNLVEILTIFESTAFLVAQESLSAKKKHTLKELIMRFDSVLDAQNLKYIIMNAPKKSLPKIKEILPAMKSPTVLPLIDEEWVAIQTVVREDEKFWDIIKKLKKLGICDILILPISRAIA